MTRDQINKIAEDSFLVYYPKSWKIKIHFKKSPDGTRYDDFVEFKLVQPDGSIESLWDLLLRAGQYQVVILEWLVNDYELSEKKRREQWAAQYGSTY